MHFCCVVPFFYAVSKSIFFLDVDKVFLCSAHGINTDQDEYRKNYCHGIESQTGKREVNNPNHVRNSCSQSEKANKEKSKGSKEKSGEEVVAKKTKANDSQNKMLITLASVFVGLVVIITTIFVLIPKIQKDSKPHS